MKLLRRAEFGLAVLLTLILVFFHISFFLHAGPLWRDEISSLSLATKPTFAQFWKFLPLDPFPVSYFLVLRLWNAIGLSDSDSALRVLGLLIGLSVIAVLWAACYWIDKSPPLWPLALFAFNPVVLETSDTLRPYGFGLIWIALAFAFLWRISSTPVTRTVAVAALIGAVLSVQSIFTNGFILVATGLAATLVSAFNRKWRPIALIISIGAICALSVLPYLPIMRGTAEWSQIVANRNSIADVIAVARDAIAAAGAISSWAWISSIVLLFIAILAGFWRRLPPMLQLQHDWLLFAGVTFLIAAVLMVGFLSAAHYLVFPRYFLPAMCVIGLCIHVFWHALPNRVSVRVVSLILAVLVSASSLARLSEQAHMRMTDCDQIANAIAKRATSDDLIIVSSFLYGVSFQRYYDGAAPWVAIPPVGDYSLHRWDLLKEAMAHPDPMPQLLSRAQSVLSSGHRIFLVGKLGPPPGQPPEQFAPAPQTEFGWQMEPYLAEWKAELAYWIEHHAVHGAPISIDNSQPVNPFEFLGGFEVSGWRGSSR